MNPKLIGLLGIARRAGHTACGFDAAAGLLKARRAALVLLASNLSEKTEKELRFAARDQRTPLIRISMDMASIGKALGYAKPVGVCATDDAGFAAAMNRCICHDLEEDETI